MVLPAFGDRTLDRYRLAVQSAETQQDNRAVELLLPTSTLNCFSNVGLAC